MSALISAVADAFKGYEPFPEVDPGIEPCGSMVLVQIRSPNDRTEGGLHLPQDVIDANMWNDQIAKVLMIGPVAFKNRSTLTEWPEGRWCEPGFLVRVPKYGGDRWSIAYGERNTLRANFVLFKDTDIVGRVRDGFDANKIKAYV